MHRTYQIFEFCNTGSEDNLLFTRNYKPCPLHYIQFSTAIVSYSFYLLCLAHRSAQPTWTYKRPKNCCSVETFFRHEHNFLHMILHYKQITLSTNKNCHKNSSHPQLIFFLMIINPEELIRNYGNFTKMCSP